MAVVSRDMTVPPEAVFRIFTDGWLYPLWVVGASHMRDVDDSWPAEGARLHHAVGGWPLLVRDTTSVLKSDPPRELILQARAWPAGQARIELTVEPLRENGSRVTINEYPVSGAGALVHNPLADKLLHRRNVESLARLAALAERRTADCP